MIYYAALLMSVVLNAVSLIVLKRYAHLSVLLPVATGKAGHLTTTLRRLVLSPAILLSVACYAFAAVFWMIALLGVDLTVAYPTVSLTYVLIALIAPKLFEEEVGPYRWIGILLIVAGVVIMHI
jgi:drug/metabolite transporter (DMT)-like permease